MAADKVLATDLEVATAPAVSVIFTACERQVGALRFEPHEQPENSTLTIDDIVLVANNTGPYTPDAFNSEGELTLVTPEITFGKRWAAFEIGKDPQGRDYHAFPDQWVHIGVVHKDDILEKGYAGWTCFDDEPPMDLMRSIAEATSCPGRFISLRNGCLFGSGYGAERPPYGDEIIQPDGVDPRRDDNGYFLPVCNVGDKIGVLMDCDSQSLLFFRNGKQWGPGYATGVVPPLSFAVDLFHSGQIMLLPDEPMPEGHATVPLPALQVHVSTTAPGQLFVVCNNIAGEELSRFALDPGSSVSDLLAQIALIVGASASRMQLLMPSGETTVELSALLLDLIEMVTSQ